jgi:hypothetical protein
MTIWLYPASCIAVPCVIGAAMYVVFSAWDRKRRRRDRDDGLPPVDYHI